MQIPSPEELNGKSVADLRKLLREMLASGEHFDGVDTRKFSAFVSIGGKKPELITAITTGQLPEEATVAAPASPVAGPVAAAGMIPLAAIQQALEAAKAEGKAEANADNQTATVELIAAYDAKLALAEQTARDAASNAAPAATVDVNGTAVTRITALPVIAASGASIRVPKADPHYILQPTTLTLIDFAGSLAVARGIPTGIMLVGPKGCGKTTTPEEWAHRNKKTFFKINAGMLREPKELFGSKSVHNGSLVFVQSELCKAFETPSCVILLDEINRCIPQALNSFYDLLSSGTTYVEEMGRVIRSAPGIIVFGSMNRGGQYHVHEVDGAMFDRFPYLVPCEYLPEKDEVKLLQAKTGVDKDGASKIVRLAAAVRDKQVEKGMGGTLTETISTRQALAIAAAYKEMGKESFKFSVESHFSADGGRESEQAFVLNIIQGIFG